MTERYIINTIMYSDNRVDNSKTDKHLLKV